MENRIQIRSGYAGRPVIEAQIDGQEYVMDVQIVELMLLKMALEKGYTTSKTARQKFTRLIINQ